MSNVVNFMLINELLCDYPRTRIHNFINPLAVFDAVNQINKSKKAIHRNEHKIILPKDCHKMKIQIKKSKKSIKSFALSDPHCSIVCMVKAASESGN